MKRKNTEAAFPYAMPQLCQQYAPGVTKKELFTGLAMMGILAAGGMSNDAVINRALVLGEKMLAALAPTETESAATAEV